MKLWRPRAGPSGRTGNVLNRATLPNNVLNEIK